MTIEESLSKSSPPDAQPVELGMIMLCEFGDSGIGEGVTLCAVERNTR
jgi:hypothetical protein